MNFLKKYRKIFYPTVLIVFLAFIYWWGGNSPVLRGFNVNKEPPAVTEEKSEKEQIQDNTDDFATQSSENIQNEETPLDIAENPTDTGTEEKKTAPVTDEKKDSGEASEINSENNELYCTLSVKCDTILKNLSWLAPEKRSLIPENGIIFEKQRVVFYDGESVFNVLLREMKKNKIHMEFSNTPMYDSVYIEGIHNIYEFDCGELSGWMYKVDGLFPNYGCSKYILNDGCNIEWVYTCDLGKDVGGEYSAKAQTDEKDKINK